MCASVRLPILSLLHPSFPSRRGGRRCTTNFQRFWQRNLAATKLDFDLTYPLFLRSSSRFFSRLSSPFFSRPFVPVSTALSFCSLHSLNFSSPAFPLSSFSSIAEFLISYASPFTSIPIALSFHPFFFFVAFLEFLILYASPFTSVPIATALSLHPFPRRFSSSLHSPNFSSSTLHLSFLFQLPVLFLHPFSFFPVFVEFLVPYTSPFILDAFFFSLHPSNFSPTLLIFHSCPNYHCSLFLRRFFSFKFFIIPSFSLSFYPLSSRSSSFPLFFLPPLSVHLDAFFLPSPNPLRYAATTYFSFSR